MSVSPDSNDNAPPAGNGSEPTNHIVIRLAERRTSDSDDLRVVAREDDLQSLQAYLAANPQLRAERVIRHTTPTNIRARERIASRGALAPIQTLTAYWRIDARSASDPERIRRALLGIPEIAIAYHESAVRNAFPAVGSPQSNPYFGNQGYLENGPKGIGAVGVWPKPGCDGSNVNVIDLESGWILSHKDLPSPQLLYGDQNLASQDARDHGAAAMGVVGGCNNNVGIIGVAPNVGSLNAVSHYDEATGTALHVADAIDAATTFLVPGDVLLLEVERYDGNAAYPTETDSADWQAIRLAVAQGIVVVEAAGNGKQNLDEWSDPTSERTLDVGADGYVDSGAILVGSAFDLVLQDGGVDGHERYYTSNYGSRVDVHAWGEHIYTAGYGSAAGTAGTAESYASSFGETSGASAIIAGAAAVIQSWLKNATGDVFDSLQMRKTLSAPSTSTPQVLQAGKPIGVMPDLKAIVAAGLPFRCRLKCLLRRLALMPAEVPDAFKAFRVARRPKRDDG